MGLLRTLKRKLIERPFWIDHEAHPNDCKGVIHIGANVGRQERHDHAKRGLRVLWVAPIPEIFTRLESNIAGLPMQRAVQVLVTEHAGEQHALKVASNNAGPSSILPMKLHPQVRPEVRFERSITLPRGRASARSSTSSTGAMTDSRAQLKPRTASIASSMRCTAWIVSPSIGFFGAFAFGTTATLKPSLAASFNRS